MDGFVVRTALFGLMSLSAMCGGDDSSQKATQRQGVGRHMTTWVEVWEGADASQGRPGARHIADLRISPEGTILLEGKLKGPSLDHLRVAVDLIAAKSSLATREDQPRMIDGEEVLVSTRVEVARGDPRYPWAVADELRKRFGFECSVRP
jgi:hypothetical protein